MCLRKAGATSGWPQLRRSPFFDSGAQGEKYSKTIPHLDLRPIRIFFFFSCLCPFILLPDPPPHIMDQNTHLGSLLVPATFLGLGGPSPVKLICERGAFHLVKMTKSKAPRLHTFVIVQVRRRGLCGFLLAETTQNGSLKCSSSTRGG